MNAPGWTAGGAIRHGLTRRAFLARAGAGLTVLFRLVPETAAAGGEAGFDAWLRILPDGNVEVYSGKVEYGQGLRTALTQIVAEELTVSPARVAIVMGDTDRVPHDAGTFGSLSIEMLRPPLQAAAAQAASALRARAAVLWSVGATATRLAAGRVLGPDGRVAELGELVADVRLVECVDPALSAPRPAAAYAVVGTSLPRVDGSAKVTGRAVFGTDLRVPGMLHGAVLHPPRAGARIEELDEAAARGAPGVVAVVRDGDFAGIVAERERQAWAALELLRPVWSAGSAGDEEQIRRRLDQAAADARTIDAADWTPPAGPPSGVACQAVYRTAFLCHATLEPQAALAELRDGAAWVVASTQRPFGVRSEVARVLGLPEAKVHVTVPEIGGAFGRKSAADAAIEAARLARAAGRPVRVVWPRRDDFLMGAYRPATRAELAAELAPDGALERWAFTLSAAGGAGSDRDAVAFYPARMRQTRYASIDPGVRTGSFRGLGAPMNAFARESFIDELARAAAIDPLRFRLRLVEKPLPRLAAVLRAAAQRAGWVPAAQPRADGTGYGLACCIYRGKTYVAEVAQVRVGAGGRSVRVERVTAAVDCGLVVNPEGLRAQVEGGVVMAASYSLGERVELAEGRMANASYADYPILRMDEAPDVEVVILDQPAEPSVGIGEPGSVPVSAAIANALYDATGRRVRELPLLAAL